MRNDHPLEQTRPNPRKWPEALRNEADRLRPSFSEDRHQRIMRAVRNGGAVEPAPRIERDRKRRTYLTAVLSAACLLCGALIVWWVLSPSQQDTPSIAETPKKTVEEPEITATNDVRHSEVDWSLSELQEPPAELAEAQASASTLWNDQWKALDHDIGRMAELTVNQWPLEEVASGDL